MSEPASPIPQYRSHKVVGALKIRSILNNNTIVPDEYGFAPIDMGDIWMEKHQPMIGGYLVFYEDGYQSYSPKQAFESGYTSVARSPAVETADPGISSQPITGYRSLSVKELALVNKLKAKAEEVRELLDTISWSTQGGPQGDCIADGRWYHIGRTHLQEGFMAIVRSITKPTTF